MAADVDEVANRLALVQHGCFARRQLIEAGVAPSTIGHRVQQGRWLPRAQGVYQLAGTPETIWSEAAGMALSVPGACVSHETAAALHGMGPLDLSGGGPVHLSIVGTSRRRNARTHRVSQLDPVDRTQLDGVPVTARPRTLVDLAMSVRQSRFEEIFARETAMGTALGDVIAAYDRVPHVGRRGMALVAELIAQRSSSEAIATSELEFRFLALLLDHDLPEPMCQVLPPWMEAVGFGRVDFLYEPVRLIVEVDGRTWHSAPTAFEADRRRDQRAAAAGWRTLRFTWNQIVRDPTYVAETLRSALSATSIVT